MQPPLLPLDHAILDRMVQAVENVRDRLRRATTALEAAKIPYAVIGGNAVAAWVARVDPGAVRNTPDVEILVHKADVELAKSSLENAGFVYRNDQVGLSFTEEPSSSLRSAVRVSFAREQANDLDNAAIPEKSDAISGYRVLSLAALVRMQLESFRTIDRVHLRDMIDVGLIDQADVDHLPDNLASRLQQVISDSRG
jgi:hypothetical protein